MKILGVIAEYNPFHNGHMLHIQKAKEAAGADYCIAVMSGNYVQRGEPALCDKWTRTEMALLGGADMVLELPSLFSCASAEFFASAAVKLICDTQIVDCICFGSEGGDIEQLKLAAEILSDEPAAFQNILRERLKSGYAYPSARADALAFFSGIEKEMLQSPNNILGIEYLKALNRLNNPMKIFAIKREGADYHSQALTGCISSATAIRKAILKGDLSQFDIAVPAACARVLQKAIADGKAPVSMDQYSDALHYRLRTMPKEALAEISDIDEGLENRILTASDASHLISALIPLIKSKRYTYTKIQRALLHVLLNIKKVDLNYFKENGYSPYIRVLGFQREKEFLLSLLSQKSSLPVLTNIKYAKKVLTPDGLRLLETEKTATDLYFMASPNLNYRKRNQEYTTPMVIL